MARAFKRSRNRRGKKEKSSIYYIEFNDHLRIKRTLPAFSNKSASDAIGHKIENLVALRMAGEAPDAALASWLESCPQKMIVKLGEWGLLAKERVVAGKPLSEHVADWRDSLLAKGTGEDRARDSHFRVMKVFTSCGFSTWSDIDDLRVERQLSGWQNDGTLAAQTRNHYVQHLKQFCQWMVDHGRASVSPLRLLKKITVTDNLRKRKRRALSDEQFGVLIIATSEDTHIVYHMDGFGRATLYVLARRTGLRWSELQALRRNSFDLKSLKPKVFVRFEDEKHPRGKPLPLTEDVANMLRAYFAAHPDTPQAKAFPMSSRRVGAEMLRHDLELAGLPYVDGDGEVFDFHSIRGQLATDMARVGITPQMTKQAMRHSDINLTLKHYTHLTTEEQRAALQQLPAMDCPISPNGKIR